MKGNGVKTRKSVSNTADTGDQTRVFGVVVERATHIRISDYPIPFDQKRFPDGKKTKQQQNDNKTPKKL